MQLVMAGVEHRTCPVEVRETLALEGRKLDDTLHRLLRSAEVEECVIISTCARTEIYLWPDQGPDNALIVARDLLVKLNPHAKDFIRVSIGVEALTHLFRVTSGLESQVVGEEEVTGQVRRAVEAAKRQNSLGENLAGVFRAAIGCSRRVRREAPRGEDELNVAAVAGSMARGLTNLAESRVLVIGSGRIGGMLCREFAMAQTVTLGTRYPMSAGAVGPEAPVEIADLDTALTHLDEYDIVCTATRSRRPVITSGHMRSLKNSVVIFDLGLPRNVDPEIRQATGARLFDVDDVRTAAGVEAGAGKRDSIITAEVHDFVSRASLRGVGPIIRSLREHVERVRDQELERVQPQLAGLEPGQRRAVETLIQRLMDRMFHHLVTRLKLAALTDEDLIRAAEFFFAHGEQGLFPDTVNVASKGDAELSPVSR